MTIAPFLLTTRGAPRKRDGWRVIKPSDFYAVTEELLQNSEQPVCGHRSTDSLLCEEISKIGAPYRRHSALKKPSEIAIEISFVCVRPLVSDLHHAVVKSLTKILYGMGSWICFLAPARSDILARPL